MGTHVFDMIKRIKENQALKNKSYFKSSSNGKANQHEHLEDRVIASEADRKKIRDLAIEESKKERRKAILISLVCLVIALILICLLLLLKF